MPIGLSTILSNLFYILKKQLMLFIFYILSFLFNEKLSKIMPKYIHSIYYAELSF